MKNIKLTIIFTTIFLTFFSCSFEKRIYQKGYHVNFSQSAKMSKGSVEVEKVENEPIIKNSINPKIEPVSFVGFVVGVFGLFMPIGLGFFMCLVALVLGIIGNSRIKNNPEKFKGKGFATVSILIGLLGIVAVVLLAL